ncbi:Interleukin-1 receptor-like 2 [Dissostichus eleginoides]|uniref:Interleukin-1 receptor-like 2 n=1 Tax=Dissostichus eleginoides TaxID=100907 RepID=A0AAD9BHF7_DISEL|nr:Interleukin-1 receptor-like 2 [Dissostichus eleginoides]
MELQASQLAVEGDFEMSCLLLPSPQSEAVTHEMEELSLQPLPPLNERKNVCTSASQDFGVVLAALRDADRWEHD